MLVDTCVWSAHFREHNESLVELLVKHSVVCHPWILGELALGPGMRADILVDLKRLPSVPVLSDEALMAFIELHTIRGIGWVDAQLLAAALYAKVCLWTTDQNLQQMAIRFAVASTL